MADPIISAAYVRSVYESAREEIGLIQLSQHRVRSFRHFIPKFAARQLLAVCDGTKSLFLGARQPRVGRATTSRLGQDESA